MLWRLTGGRPMRREGYAFTDQVTGKGVLYFRDRLGRKWLAEGPWSFFRVPTNPHPLAHGEVKENKHGD
jgi:hypothetical protein